MTNFVVSVFPAPDSPLIRTVLIPGLWGLQVNRSGECSEVSRVSRRLALLAVANAAVCGICRVEDVPGIEEFKSLAFGEHKKSRKSGSLAKSRLGGWLGRHEALENLIDVN